MGAPGMRVEGLRSEGRIRMTKVSDRIPALAQEWKLGPGGGGGRVGYGRTLMTPWEAMPNMGTATACFTRASPCRSVQSSDFGSWGFGILPDAHVTSKWIGSMKNASHPNYSHDDIRLLW